MMRIGLISDTHIPDHAAELPGQLKDVFCGVGLILHAGDIYAVSVLDELESIAPVLAAEGDDDAEVLGDRRVKMRQIITVEGVTIWLEHIIPFSWRLIPKENPDLKRPDVIVFGHTHEATIENKEGILLVNPGSPTFPHYQLKLGTVALLTVNSGKAEAHIVQLQ